MSRFISILLALASLTLIAVAVPFTFVGGAKRVAEEATVAQPPPMWVEVEPDWVKWTKIPQKGYPSECMVIKIVE